jgi:L-2,4-diaminobutyrate decarboxylase
MQSHENEAATTLGHEECLQAIKRLLIAPEDSNRDEFAIELQAALATLPAASAYDPYIGTASPDMSWLADYETVPDAGLDPSKAVAASLGALRGQIRWHSLAALNNVNQPVLRTAWAAHAITSLYNPNALWDLVSGGCLEMERQVIRQLSTLMAWNPDVCDGLFTFGGKAGLIYAIRLGLNRCFPDFSRSGLNGSAPIVLTTEQNHYSVESACSLIGIGTDSVVNVQTGRDGTMDLTAFRDELLRCSAQRRHVACIILSGGNTLDAIVDPLQGVADTLDELVRNQTLAYRPWIHCDLSLGWPWLFFSDYDFHANPLGSPAAGLASARTMAERITHAGIADSTCFDFHKLGFAPYPGSVFLTRRWRELRSAFRDDHPDDQWMPYGENFRQHHSIEHSRSAAPIVAAWVVLQSLGRDGFRSYLAHLHEVTSYLRRRLALARMTVLNAPSPSLATLVSPFLPGISLPDAMRDHSKAELRNLYIESLFRFVTGLNGTDEDPIAIGFVPGYLQTDHCTRLSALRLYTTNPFLEKSHIDSVVDHLSALQCRFDDFVSQGRTGQQGSRLVHTPI